MSVAVTGASGFCGGVVARLLLAHGYDVVSLGRRPGPDGTEHRRWDASVDTPDLVGCAAVVHLAAAVGDPRPGTDAREFERVNVDGARRLLEAAGDRPVVWVSSSSVYDPRPDRTRVTEDHPTSGGHLNAYGRTKALGDRLALDAGAVVLRPRAVYGPGDTHLLPRLLRATRRGRIVLPGHDVELSLTHVDNLAGACVAALGWVPGPYNVADEVPVRRDATLVDVLEAALARPVAVGHVPVPVAARAADVLDTLARLTGREPLLTPYAVDTLAHTFCLDTTRARSTGWRPRDLMADYLATLGEWPPDSVPPTRSRSRTRPGG
ncbi:NAD(P)-dependent oxidoreductase [Nocardioides sp.]|uniref:NAD-dependent epimerase/dehydratase family protein n=1 Tax=Nocardioides sp. TaxID=35761 RepID=UPI0027202F3D|nr:NAD(P)-dependent oxidoreductase [Nocardioides sp.]MDO9455424.1 NAD(P)-dependent oxidoreductase [Nocardioides sp.]